MLTSLSHKPCGGATLCTPSIGAAFPKQQCPLLALADPMTSFLGAANLQEVAEACCDIVCLQEANHYGVLLGVSSTWQPEGCRLMADDLISASLQAIIMEPNQVHRLSPT